MPGIEGPDPGVSARRGRRSAEAAQELAEAEARRLADEQDQMDRGMNDSIIPGAGEFDPDEPPVLYPGDIMMAKSSISMEVAGQEAWFTVGAQTRVQPHETEEDTFMRLGSSVTERVLDLAAASEREIYEEIERQRKEAQRRPIQPRRNH